MTKYREILRLNSMGLSQRSIASSIQCSRNTVSEVLQRVNEKELSWPLPEDVVEADLQYLLFPEKAQTSSRKVVLVQGFKKIRSYPTIYTLTMPLNQISYLAIQQQ
jgi:IS30 family transposase